MGNEQSASSEPTQNGKIPEKHENGSVNGLSATITSNGVEINVKNNTTIHQNGEPQSSKSTTETTDSVVVESEVQSAASKVVSEIIDTASKITDTTSETDSTSKPSDSTSETTASASSEERVKRGKEEKGRLFGKLFKKKADRKADGEMVQEKEKETSSEDQVDVSPPDPQQDTVSLKQESESAAEPPSAETADPGPDPGPEEETAPEREDGNAQPEESQEEGNPEEKSVMNFFKTLVTSTKTPKKETVGPDAAKDQSLKETQPAATTTVAQMSEQPAAPKGMPAPPPPPPEPPKLETKGEPATKPTKPAPKEEAKAAAKQTEAAKGKSAKDTLSKFFRPKVLLGVKKPKGKGAIASGANAKPATVTIKESPQPAAEVEPVVGVKETSVEVPEPVVEVQIIENKVELQEAAVEVAQQILEEQKVDPSKAGTLEAAAKAEPPPPVQEEKKADSKSSFMSLFKSKAAEPKKTTQAPPAATETAQVVKAKEEPKAAAKSPEAVVDNKPVSAACQAGDDAPVPKKLEKRNSIQLFFKNLGQKRHSTDAGVQTEAVIVAPATEKTK